MCSTGTGHLDKLYKAVSSEMSSESHLRRLCGKKGKSVQHLVSGCKKLAQKEYKRRHNNKAKKVHWVLCKKNGLEHTEKWYEQVNSK